MPDPTTLYIILVIFIATLIRSAFGFGEALVAVPLLALRIPVATAAPLAVLASVTAATVIVLQDHRSIHFRPAAGLILASLPGIPLGLWLLTTVNDGVVKVVLSTFLITYAVYSLGARRKLHLQKDHPGLLLTCGFFAGVLGGAYGMNGPALAIYGSLRRWSPQQFRATLQAYFLPASAIGLLGFRVTGLWAPEVTHDYLVALGPALIAVFIGRAINRRLQDDAYLKILYASLILIGIILLVQTFRGTPAAYS